MLGIMTLSDNPEDTFITSILDSVYTIKTQRNTLGFWTLGVFNEDGTPLVYSVKIVAGSHILEPYANIPFDLYIPGDSDPTRTNLSSFAVEVLEK